MIKKLRFSKNGNVAFDVNLMVNQGYEMDVLAFLKRWKENVLQSGYTITGEWNN